MVHVASQPSAFSRRVTVKAPITRWSLASSIITIMIGTAITPLITALQNSALMGSTGVKSRRDRKSTRLNSSHLGISYAVFCLKKKNDHNTAYTQADK